MEKLLIHILHRYSQKSVRKSKLLKIQLELPSSSHFNLLHQITRTSDRLIHVMITLLYLMIAYEVYHYAVPSKIAVISVPSKIAVISVF